MSIAEHGCGVESSTAASGDDALAPLVRWKDWSRTPLGPRERWPQSLRTLPEVVLAHPLPMAANQSLSQSVVKPDESRHHP